MSNPHGARDFDDSDRDLKLIRLVREHAALEARVASLEAQLEEHRASVEAQLEELRSARPAGDLEGRNKSSAAIRDMTDADAERVLVGDLAGANHKEAAALAGLTYAQVYSCRLHYTFKHVHRRLRDESGFETPWRRGGGRS